MPSCIGGAGVDAEAETLFMAIETLDAVGLSDARFDINSAALVDGVLTGLGLGGEDLLAQKKLVAGRNVVAIENPAIRELTMMRGREDLLAYVRPFCETPESVRALTDLEHVLDRARALGYRERINIDFGLLRDLEYYTGFVFEGYIGDLGFSLCGGGRYDTLLPRFGYDVPAVGWMVGVERILLALERRREDERPRAEVDVLVSGSDRLAAIERAKGLRVRVDVRNLSRRDLIGYAIHKRIPRVIIAGAGEPEEITL